MTLVFRCRGCQTFVFRCSETVTWRRKLGNKNGLLWKKSSWKENILFWPFLPIRGHCLLIRGFAITLIEHTTLCRTALDKWSARRRDLYLTTHNTHTRQTFMPQAGFKLTILVCERQQTHSLDRTVTEIGQKKILSCTNKAVLTDLGRWFSRNTNNMQLCNRIYYSKVYWMLNMFRAAHRSSSGAINRVCNLWFIYKCGDRPLSRLSGKCISHSALTTAGHHMGI
jgi:hypothetical protein